MEGVTLILISHKKAAAAVCNRKFRLAKKKIVEVTD